MKKAEYFVDWTDNSKGKSRPDQHIIGELGVNILKELLPKEWAVREYTPDYGIDIDVELFESDSRGICKAKGEHVLFQVKGTRKTNKRTIKIYNKMNAEKGNKEDKSDFYLMDVIQYSIDTDLLVTIERMESAVPVLLAVVDVENKIAYCVCLNDYIEKIIIPKKLDYFSQGSITINIPVENQINTNFDKRIIEWYGKRAKLYAFFNMVNYQLRELGYSTNREYIRLTDHFFKKLCRLDVWSAADYFPALKIVRKEIDYYFEHHNTKVGEQMIRDMMERGEEVDSEIYEATYCVGSVSFKEATIVQELHRLWENLTNVADIFEDLAKEAFLPSYYECMNSFLYNSKCRRQVSQT